VPRERETEFIDQVTHITIQLICQEIQRMAASVGNRPSQLAVTNNIKIRFQ